MNNMRLISTVSLTLFFLCCLTTVAFFPLRTEAQTDTLDADRVYQLDTIRFLNTYQKNIDLIHTDTLIAEIEGKFYRIPYRVSLRSVDVADNMPKIFTITSLGLRDYPDFGKRLKDIFDNPRDKLYTYYSAKDWRFSEEYDRFFRQYDNNRTATITDQTDDGLLGDETTGKTTSVDEIDFPLPATVDIDVNLEKDPGMVTILGVEFNYNKLDPEFKSFLINFKDNRNRSGNKSILK
jgi:hypothetical protein